MTLEDSVTGIKIQSCRDIAWVLVELSYASLDIKVYEYEHVK